MPTGKRPFLLANRKRKRQSISFIGCLSLQGGHAVRHCSPFFVGMGLAPPSGMINATGKREPPHLMLRTNWVGVCLRTLRNARTKLE